MKAVLLMLLLVVAGQPASGQFDPSMQDSTLNNLVLPAGYRTCKPGELGEVRKSGSGKQSIILVAGLCFGGKSIEELAEHFESKFTVYTVTPAGFEGTPAPPMPDSGTPYHAMTWTNGIVTGILSLIQKEHLTKPTIVAHFVTGTQVGLLLALEHGDEIGKVIVIGGSPYRYYQSKDKDGGWTDWSHEYRLTPAQREKIIESYWGPRWFKTVTKKTWDDNMWTASDYCINEASGHRLFRASAETPLPVAIRYLMEWFAFDISERYRDIKNPLLALVPDFESMLPVGDSAATASCNKLYLKYYHQASWRLAAESGNSLLTIREITNTRLFMWLDNPRGVYAEIDNFLQEH
jgi:pimeloyl-ACP methyl ester carboxylesterase